jgi:hypothetical protein
VRPERHAAAAPDLSSQLTYTAEQLKDEPPAEHQPCGQVHERDEEEDDQCEDSSSGEHEQVGPKYPRDGARRSDVRDDGVRRQRDLRGRRGDPRNNVEQRISNNPQLVFDVVAKDPQEQHIAADVQPPAVEEHGDEDRLPP